MYEDIFKNTIAMYNEHTPIKTSKNLKTNAYREIVKCLLELVFFFFSKPLSFPQSRLPHRHCLIVRILEVLILTKWVCLSAFLDLPFPDILQTAASSCSNNRGAALEGISS